MITILTHDSRIFYAENNDSLYAYTDKKLTSNKHYRIKNIIKNENVPAGTNISIYNFNILKKMFPVLPEYGKEYVFPESVDDQPFKLLEINDKKELFYIETLVGVNEQLYRKIDDEWFPKTIATLYKMENDIAVEYQNNKSEYYLSEDLITNTGDRFFKYAFSDDDSSVFIYYREEDKNHANPFYYVNKMVNYNSETGLYDFVAPNVFPGFGNSNLNEDDLIKIMANGRRDIHYFVPIRNIDKIEILKTHSDILIFIPYTQSIYREYTNYGKLANGDWINFFANGDLRIYNKSDVEHIENLYTHFPSGDETFLVPYSNKNNPRISNFGNLSEMYKLSAEVKDIPKTANVEEMRKKLVHDIDDNQIAVEYLEEKKDRNEENKIEYKILTNTIYFTLNALLAMKNGTYKDSLSLLDSNLGISENSFNLIEEYSNSNSQHLNKIISITLGVELEPDFIRIGNDDNLYYKYNPYPLFRYDGVIYKELLSGNYKKILENNDVLDINDIVIKSLKTSDGRIVFYAYNDRSSDANQMFVFSDNNVYANPLLNLNRLFLTTSYQEFVTIFNNGIENSIYSHLLPITEETYNKIKRALTNLDIQIVPLSVINDIKIFKNLIFYPVKFDYIIDKMLYRCSFDIYSDNKFYYESSIVPNTFIAYGEVDRNVILRSIESFDGRTFYYSSEFESINFENDIFEAYTGVDGISGIKYYNVNYLKTKDIDTIKSKLGNLAVAYTGELDNKYKNSNITGINLLNNIFDVVFDKNKPETIFYSEDKTFYKSLKEGYSEPANKWQQSKFDPEIMIRYGQTDVDLSAPLRIYATINMDYNRPRVLVSGNTIIEHILYAKGKIISSDFELFINDENNNIPNIKRVNSLEELNRVRFKDEGLYSIYIKNVDGYYTLNNCLSTFRDPVFNIREIDKQIVINVETELEVTSVKISYGYQSEDYFTNNGLVIPVDNLEQKDFVFIPTNSWYGKYTVYITLRTGKSYIHKFLLGSDFIGKSEIIEDLQSNYYAMVTKFAPNELERFYNNLNVVYPLCSRTESDDNLEALLNDRETVKVAELNYYNNYLSLGSFDILDKFIDPRNIFNIKINIPVDISVNVEDYYIFGFLVYSEKDNKPVIVFKLEEPVRKENTVNMDFNLPLSVILGLKRSEYPEYIFSEKNTLVTISYLNKVLSNFNNNYAYASKELVADLRARLDYKLTDLDPELKKLKENVDIILGSKIEVLEYLQQVKDEVKKISEELYPSIENYINQTKNSMIGLGDGISESIDNLKKSSLSSIEGATNEAISKIKTIVNKDSVSTDITMQGLYHFMTIPNTDEEYHKYHFKTTFSSGRKVNFYMDLYTSILDTQIDNEMQIPFIDIRFVASNSDKFCYEDLCGPYGLSFYIVKKSTETVIYLYFYEAATFVYSGQYYLFPNINYYAPRPNFDNYQRLDIGINPIFTTVVNQ